MTGTERGPRVGYLSPFPPEKEGVGDYLQALLVAAGRTDPAFRATVFCQPSGDAANTPIGEDVQVRRSWRPNSLRSLLRIRRWFASSDFDCIHLEFGPYRKFGGLGGEPLLAVFLASRARKRSVVTLHSFWLREQLEQRLRERYERPRLSGRLPAWGLRTFMRLLLRQFERVVLLTNVENDALVKAFCGEFRVPRERIVQWVHPCGEGEAGTAGHAERIPRAGPLRVVCPGFISPRKGLEAVIEAATGLEGVPPFVLRIVGECVTDEDRAYLAALRKAAETAAGSVTFEFATEPMDASALTREVGAADAVVLTHSYRVGPSGLLSRFTALGTPIVATTDPLFLPPTPGVPWLLVPPRDTAALRNALRRLLTEPGLRKALSESSLSWAAAHSYRAHAREHLDLYRRLIEAP